ncbi:MAG: response regulator [Deltaproteobacteria bacterium]|nr:response regulator [Deltaproteobacteria bacterium]
MKPLKTILLIEDDRVDYITVARALREVGDRNDLVNAKNGEEALAFLKAPENKKPCVILLDINMPRMNGIEFLRVVKNDPDLRRIPVVVLTTSRAEQDIEASFDLGVAGYMVKPLDYREFIEMVITVARYWRLSALPEG